jgi:hypothetical protein
MESKTARAGFDLAPESLRYFVFGFALAAADAFPVSLRSALANAETFRDETRATRPNTVATRLTRSRAWPATLRAPRVIWTAVFA